MGVYVVTFDSPTQDYRRFHDWVMRFDAMRLTDSAWAVQTELGADELYNDLKPLLQGDDVSYVVALCKPWIGFGYEAMNDWLHRHL